MSLFTRQTSSDAVTATQYEKIIGIRFTDTAVIVTYARTLALPDGTEVTLGQFAVNRQIEDVSTDVQASIAGLAQLAEKWRVEDEAAAVASQAAIAAAAIPDKG